MKEISDIINAYDALENSDKAAVAMVTVVEVDGSSYRRTGARMLVQANGVWTGGISGGCLEGDALKKANLVMTRKSAMLVTYDTSKDDAYEIGVGLGCNGIITVLIHAIDPSNSANEIEMLRQISNSRQSHVRITIVESDHMMAGTMHDTDNLLSGVSNDKSVRQTIDECLTAGKSRMAQINLDKFFFEVIKPSIRVVLFGSNYDLYAMLNLGKEMGWKIEIASKSKRIPKHITKLAGLISDPETIVDDRYTAFVLMAHDLKTDKSNLKIALKTGVKYIGMLGPKKRRERILNELKDEGIMINDKDNLRIFNPVGLDIGATTPEEIAISAIGEITAFFNGRAGGSLRQRKGPINDRN